MPSAPLCVVCGSPRKYKCPTCAAPYCSVACFGAHKVACAPLTAAAPVPGRRAPPVPSQDEEGADVGDGVTLTDDDFRALAADADLRTSLRDPALQRALLAIDSASDRPKALADAAAADPRLRGFLDSMLLAMGKAQRGPGGAVVFTG